jgi:hypothetical protein
MHPRQDLFLESFSYELQLDMHSYLHKKFYSCKKWVLQLASSFSSSVIGGGFGGGGTQRLKDRNGENAFLSYGKRRICRSTNSGPSIH